MSKDQGQDKSIDKKTPGGHLGGTKFGQVPGEATQPKDAPDINPDRKINDKTNH